MNFSVNFEPSQAEIIRWITRFGTAKHKKVVKTILKYALDIQAGAKAKLKEEKAIDVGCLAQFHYRRTHTGWPPG